MGIRPQYADTSLRPTDSDQQNTKHSFRFGMWQKLHHFFAKDDPTESPIECTDQDQWPQPWHPTDTANRDSSTRPVGIGLPRQTTFRRQNSERRERLLPVEPCAAERRALSMTRHSSSVLRPRTSSLPSPRDPARTSAPAVAITARADINNDESINPIHPSFDATLPGSVDEPWTQPDHRPPRPPSTTSSDDSYHPRLPYFEDKAELRNELDSRWILNLSMHFRDKSDREKFFITYAETPSRWRRVTISCDYRNAEPGSLEMDLKELQFQRDKSMQIYESIRDSLPDIQFYDTVTNLKLETTDGRLHVHVTEDVNEIIPYPPRSTVDHVLKDRVYQPVEVRESELVFDAHLSGFVYKVRYNGKTFIKKEIPGPDTVDEFLYEVNALHALHDSKHVIKLEAIVVDDTNTMVKGLLISFAEKGAIVDLLYDHRGAIPWEDRVRWAEHAVRGLGEIHEEGYVQGDFTLSNIVVDGDGNAKIIDINRRGCPVGWEPPEIATKIASNQRISMYIGEKSDLYQLGMTLWALAMDDDEPERHDPPLSVEEFPSEIPEWYQDIVRICLSARPRDRLSAKELAELFPKEGQRPSVSLTKRPTLKLQTPKDYIDPRDAVERDDIERLSSRQPEIAQTPYSPESSRDDYTFTYPRSSNYEIDSQSSAYDRPRGRRPPTNFGHLSRTERNHWLPSDQRSIAGEEEEPQYVAISPGQTYEELNLDGRTYLVQRNTFNQEELKILEEISQEDREPQCTDLPTNDATPVVIEEASVQTPLRPRRPSLPTHDSNTSDSTPRGSHATLPPFAQHPIPQLENYDASAADLVGSGSNLNISTSRDDACGRWKSSDSYVESSGSPPCRLRYTDSGFDEPIDEATEAAVEAGSGLPVLTELVSLEQPQLPTEHLKSMADNPNTDSGSETLFDLNAAENKDSCPTPQPALDEGAQYRSNSPHSNDVRPLQLDPEELSTPDATPDKPIQHQQPDSALPKVLPNEEALAEPSSHEGCGVTSVPSRDADCAAESDHSPDLTIP